MTIYYVAANGNDGNNGTSPSTPWQSIGKVNSFQNSLNLGDSVLFNCGDTFYGRLACAPNLSTSSFTNTLTYGNYGANPQLPIISAYKIANISGGWANQGGNVWALNYTAGNVGNTYTGDPNGATGQYGYDVGFLKINGGQDTPLSMRGILYCSKYFNTGSLSHQWDFYSDQTSGTLFVYSVGNPTTQASDIRFSTGGWSTYGSVTMGSGVTINGLCFEGNGGHLIEMSGDHQQVLNCVLAEYGGSLLYSQTTYGNGIQFDLGSNFNGQGNVIRDGYNVAWTMQGGNNWTNVTWKNNITYRNTQATEYDASGSGPQFVNCIDQYNTNVYNGFGGMQQNIEFPINNCCEQLTYEWTTSGATFQVFNNCYFGGFGGNVPICYSYSLSNSSPIPHEYNSHNNYLAAPSGTLIQSSAQGFNETIDAPGPANWQAATGRETNSTWEVLTIPTWPGPSASTSYLNAVPDAWVYAAIAHCRLNAPAYGTWGFGRRDAIAAGAYPGGQFFF